MAHFERIRDLVSEPFSPDVIRRRIADGWQMVAIEWRRELPDAEAPIEAFNEDIPYGLRISDDCQRLEPDPTEHRVLMLMMELLAQDFSYMQIVACLNQQGFRMRNGQPWNRVAVFRMIPRLIEVGPRFFSSGEWAERRQHWAIDSSLQGEQRSCSVRLGNLALVLVHFGCVYLTLAVWETANTPRYAPKHSVGFIWGALSIQSRLEISKYLT
jgi:Recombinase